MNSTVSVTAKRSFAGSFSIATQLWFATPSGYLSIVFIAAMMAYIFYDPGYPWIAIGGGLAWVAVMLLFVFTVQAWKITKWSQTMGQPVYLFDEESATCQSGQMVTRIPWSGIKRIRLTRKTCFLYITKQTVWFFGRDELSKQDESTMLEFARRSNVKLTGNVAA